MWETAYDLQMLQQRSQTTHTVCIEIAVRVCLRREVVLAHKLFMHIENTHLLLCRDDAGAGTHRPCGETNASVTTYTTDESNATQESRHMIGTTGSTTVVRKFTCHTRGIQRLTPCKTSLRENNCILNFEFSDIGQGSTYAYSRTHQQHSTRPSRQYCMLQRVVPLFLAIRDVGDAHLTRPDPDLCAFERAVVQQQT